MFSTVLANILESYLGKYLELSDTSISVGKEVWLENVRLKEAAFSELGLPIKVIHGKIAKLVIKIPWFQPFTQRTILKLDGLHLLLVPSSSVAYDEEKEKQEACETKQRRLMRAEQAKNLAALSAEHEESKDTFTQRLAANIIKNLEITITNVHIRYEDSQKGSDSFAFAAGFTLQELLLSTKQDQNSGDGGAEKVFEKEVSLNGFAIYWKPKLKTMYSSGNLLEDDGIDDTFNNFIGTKDNPSVGLQYLLGPINSSAKLKWCINPALYKHNVPETDVMINIEELSLCLTKYQYQNFLMLLQNFEYLSRAANYRKYKAEFMLENLPNYRGHSRSLWKFAFTCILEEEVMRKKRNWSWEHMKKHVHMCKTYRELYKEKLVTSKPSKKQLQTLREYEDALDEFNICIQRQLAESELAKSKAEKLEEKKQVAKSSWWSWWSGSKQESGEDVSDEGQLSADLKKLEQALTAEEKEELYDVINYQAHASESTSSYPKSFVANVWAFCLNKLLISICDEDLKCKAVVALSLENVKCDIIQRPSAKGYFKLEMTMETLTVRGFQHNRCNEPTIVKTMTNHDSNLLTICVENNPPENPDGDLEEDGGSPWDKRIKISSSPLELTYDKLTFKHLKSVLHNPQHDLQLASLQQTASAKLNELKESTALGIQFAYENHTLVDIDVNLQSSHIIIPHEGDATNRNCAFAVASLGCIRVKSKPIAWELLRIKQLQDSKELLKDLENSLYSKAYDKFDVCLENLQVMVALPNEPWRDHVKSRSSPMFMLKPTTIRVQLQCCIKKNNPDLPIFKVSGTLEKISFNIADYRLLRLAIILDSLSEPDILEHAESNDSMHSAMSSLAMTGSSVNQVFKPSASARPLPKLVMLDHQDSMDGQEMAQLTTLVYDFKIGDISLNISEMEKGSSRDRDIFEFRVAGMESHGRIRDFDLTGDFQIGTLSCRHLLAKVPNSNERGVDIVTSKKSNEDEVLLKIKFTKVQQRSPEFVTLYGSTLKHMEVYFSSVQINFHQDAVIDLMEKLKKLAEELSKKVRHLMAERDEPESPKPTRRRNPSELSNTVEQQPFKRQNSQRKSGRLSLKTAANLVRWTRSKSSGKPELILVKVTASLAGVSLTFLTSQIRLATMNIKDVGLQYKQTKALREIRAKLINFEVKDATEAMSNYVNIVESIDERVFDATIQMFDPSKKAKAASLQAVDFSVKAVMGRVRVVYLNKFVTDFLRFLDPFAEAKEVMADKANNALEAATESMVMAYNDATRCQMDIEMFAPLIIIPVNSTSRMTFIADLGKLQFKNFFIENSGKVFDEMHFNMRNLTLHRAMLDASADCNQVLSQCMIVLPISFDLKVRRNMVPSLKKTDPPELSVTGTLCEIKVELSKEDYGVMMSMLNENFNEKGQFEETATVPTDVNRQQAGGGLQLPLKSKYKSGSRGSLSSAGASSLKEAIVKSADREPDTRAVEFNFSFRGFEAKLYSGNTPLDENVPEVVRDESASLAKFMIQLLSVKGNMLANSSLEAKAYLDNLVLEDSRLHNPLPGSLSGADGFSLTTSEGSQTSRIVRLMEAKQEPGSKTRNRMVDILYKRDSEGNQDVDVSWFFFFCQKQ